MTKIQAAEAATKNLEQALQRYTTTAERLTTAEGILLKLRTEYNAAIAAFDESEKARRRVREVSDEVEMAKATVGRLKREMKDAAAALIEPTQIARTEVQEAIRGAREDRLAAIEDALRPFIEDEKFLKRTVAGIFDATKGSRAFRAGPGTVYLEKEGIEVLAKAILTQCRSSLRGLALV